MERKETTADGHTQEYMIRERERERRQKNLELKLSREGIDGGFLLTGLAIGPFLIRNLHLRYAAGIAGNLFAFVLFVAPIPTFRRIIRNRSTEHFSVLPYIYSLLNCFICSWYGLPWVAGVLLIATVNSIGALFQLAYVAIFIVSADRAPRLKVSGLLLAVFGVFAVVVYASLSFMDGPLRQEFVGYLSVLSLVSMFASPLFIINLVVRTRSVEFMPFYLSLATFLMSISFFAYGMLLRDHFVYIPNGIGTVLGITQLLLYAYYSRKSIGQDSRLPLLSSYG